MSQSNSDSNAKRPNPEIDEALAWLENINSSSEKKPAQGEGTYASKEVEREFPTWLREDLGLAQAAKDSESAANADDNLSWLDAVASGQDAPLAASPTMSWADTNAYNADGSELPTKAMPQETASSAARAQLEKAHEEPERDIESTAMLPIPTREQLEAARSDISAEPPLPPSFFDAPIPPPPIQSSGQAGIAVDAPFPDIPLDFDHIGDTYNGTTSLPGFAEIDTQGSKDNPFADALSDTAGSAEPDYDTAAVREMASAVEQEELPTVSPTPSEIANMPDIEEIRRVINEELEVIKAKQANATEGTHITNEPEVEAARKDLGARPAMPIDTAPTDTNTGLISADTEQTGEPGPFETDRTEDFVPAHAESEALPEALHDEKPPTIGDDITTTIVADAPDFEAEAREAAELAQPPETGIDVTAQMQAPTFEETDLPTASSSIIGRENAGNSNKTVVAQSDMLENNPNAQYASEAPEIYDYLPSLGEPETEITAEHDQPEAVEITSSAPAAQPTPEYVDEGTVADASFGAELEEIRAAQLDAEIKAAQEADLAMPEIDNLGAGVSAENNAISAAESKPKIVIPGIKPVKQKASPKNNDIADKDQALVELDFTSEIPDDPDEAIAWLEQMAGKRNEYPYDEDFDTRITDDADRLPEKPKTFLPTPMPEFDHSEALTMIAPREIFAADADMEAFLQGLEQSFDQEIARTSPQTDDSAESENIKRDLEELGIEMPEGDTLEWLEQLVEGTDTSLDEMTVELDQMDLAALLDEENLEELRPSREKDVAVSAEKLVDPAAPKAGESELLFDDPVDQDELPTIVLEHPLPEPQLPANFKPNGSEANGALAGDSEEEGSQLHEALHWLETFAEEESSIVANHDQLVKNALGEDFSEGTVIEVFRSERVRARAAVESGDYKTVANEYTSLLQHDGADEIVIGDMLRLLENIQDQPLLYMVLGDALKKQGDDVQAMSTYRKGLNVMLA